MKHLTMTLLFLLISMSAWGECVKDFGTPEWFGSYEQLQYIQKEIKSNRCDFVQIFWKNKAVYPLKRPLRMLAVDVSQGVMIRTRVTPWEWDRYSWELWYGFDKSMILNDDPSDGFDLPNYTVEYKTNLRKELNKAFISMEKLEEFRNLIKKESQKLK